VSNGASYLARSRGGPEGNQAYADPMSLTTKQLVDLACSLARIGTVLCDLGGMHQAQAQADEPYIWDVPSPEE